MPERAPFFLWRSLIIVASYTYIAGSGPVPVTVDFTDTSTGSPTKWLWNFGDGQSSDEQHPSHIYTVAGLYTVSLTAFIPSGVSNVFPNPLSAIHKTGAGSTNALAYAAWQAASYTSADPNEWSSYFLDKFSASSYQYYARKITYDVNLNSHAGRIILLVVRYDTSGSTPASGAKIPLGGVFRVLPDFTRLLVADVSSWGGSTPTYEIDDITNHAQLPEPVTGDASGWSDSWFQFESYGVSEGDSTSQDINIAVDWCGLGWLLVSKNIVVISPTERNLVVETDRQVHLTAKYMLEKPNKSVKWRIKYGMPYRCYPHYDLSYKGSVEQLEPSDTLVHTFPINLMLSSATLNVVLSGEQCGDQVASRSPLIEVDSVFV